jgi:TRAP-type transport system periplasmic protein
MQRRELLLAGAGLVLGGTGRAAGPWRLATGYRAESFHGQNLLAFAQEVAAATREAVRIELHPHNSLVPLPQIFAAAAEGRIEAGEAIMTGLADRLPLAGADAVPFVVGSYGAQRGLTVLYAVPWPPQGLFSRRPVQRVADLAGTRMRTYNATTVRIAQLLGAEPVDVAMVDVGRALAEGRIDTMITSAVTGVENQVWGPVKHYYDINAWIPKNIVFVRTVLLDALAPAAREAVFTAAHSAEARGWAASRDVARSSVLELQRQGVQVDPVHPHLARDLKRLGERFSLEWIRAVGREANDIFIPYYTQA